MVRESNIKKNLNAHDIKHTVTAPDLNTSDPNATNTSSPLPHLLTSDTH
jgi:hypothetical protein